MASEQSILNQVAAMEGWAIKAKQQSDNGKYAEAIELLQTLNTQGRRLEWRGLRKFSSFSEVQPLKKLISEARAAAQTGIGQLKKLATQQAKARKLSGAEKAAAQQVLSQKFREAGKNVSILIEVLKKAKAITDQPLFLSPEEIAADPLKIVQLLRREGIYKSMGDNIRRHLVLEVISLVRNGRVLIGADLTGADLIFVDFTQANLSGADLTGANLTKSNLTGANLTEANLSGADLSKVNLSKANLSKANLFGANLSKANLSGADLRGADLKRANLSKANLTETNFSGADLTGAYLPEADLTKANLEEAYLVGANLFGANLTETNLSKANLSKANLTETNFSGANLADVSGLTSAQLRFTKNWKKAKNIPFGL